MTEKNKSTKKTAAEEKKIRQEMTAQRLQTMGLGLANKPTIKNHKVKEETSNSGLGKMFLLLIALVAGYIAYQQFVNQQPWLVTINAIQTTAVEKYNSFKKAIAWDNKSQLTEAESQVINQEISAMPASISSELNPQPSSIPLKQSVSTDTPKATLPQTIIPGNTSTQNIISKPVKHITHFNETMTSKVLANQKKKQATTQHPPTSTKKAATYYPYTYARPHYYPYARHPAYQVPLQPPVTPVYPSNPYRMPANRYYPYYPQR